MLGKTSGQKLDKIVSRKRRLKIEILDNTTFDFLSCYEELLGFFQVRESNDKNPFQREKNTNMKKYLIMWINKRPSLNVLLGPRHSLTTKHLFKYLGGYSQNFLSQILKIFVTLTWAFRAN